MTLPAEPARNLRLGHLIGAGLVDSTGLAFGWTVVLLLVAQQRGLAAAALMTSSSLVGTALAAPCSAWLSARWSARHLLQRLAVVEAITRASLFVLMAAGGRPAVMAPLVVLTSVIAWSAYAAMRAQVGRVGRVGEERSGSGPTGSGLTWYAAAILASEAVAAGGASLLIVHPSRPALVVVAVIYTCSLAPQWWVGAHADPVPVPPARTGFRVRTIMRPVVAPTVVGALVFLMAAGPASMAAVLAFERRGAAGVTVAALSFTAGSLGSARLQAWITRIPSPGVAACLLGAAMVGCWAAFPLGLPALALTMLCVGLTHCCIEGDLDARTLAGLDADHSSAVTGLAMASSSRAIGGAAAVAVLPAVITVVSLPVASALAGALLLAAAAVLALLPTQRPCKASTVTATEVGNCSSASLEPFLTSVDTLAHLAAGRAPVTPRPAPPALAGS